ncbi:MAG: class I SAM-dependent methyltransferase [Peptostreptococcaceae bacterium]|nr:class I SAM-dependent methyltransferase [Peptostreptococcaceae bacterium]
MKRKMNIFNLIAPAYGLFYDYQKKHYMANIDILQEGIDLSKYKNIIDVGCGTGALCSVLKQKGLLVTGVDLSQRMLKIGAKKPENTEVKFFKGNVLDRLPFEGKSFDLSVASFVAHGLKRNERKMMYAEMSRITKHVVIIYDYTEKRSVLTSIVEWTEGGDYFNFIKKTKTEMKKSFRDVHVINAGVRGAWYICTPFDKA